MENVKCESYPIGEESQFVAYEELKGSKLAAEKKPINSNCYAAENK
ncbi:hypothetical protein N482_15260 [Pseudoalteromonas luteoviolacea NCIMB 1942]|uniref:Uncharacterized protein n=1 Tax=Pseudoalteromonas luteoviolacea NCIMB 1942 TaxID=1365253 RepID=A0A167A9Q9_9GAMM|nr:hypothetical protein N482_15260 [Pseudoalteromonas luteoviolacea NCIMB 1942]